MALLILSPSGFWRRGIWAPREDDHEDEAAAKRAKVPSKNDFKQQGRVDAGASVEAYSSFWSAKSTGSADRYNAAGGGNGPEKR